MPAEVVLGLKVLVEFVLGNRLSVGYLAGVGLIRVEV